MQSPRFRMHCFSLVVAVGCFCGLVTTADAVPCAPEDARITINHKLGTVSPDGIVRLRHDQFFCIEIVDTNTDCITINFEEVAPNALMGPAPSTVEFRVQHHQDVGAYKVAIGVDKDPQCAAFQQLTREIPVETYGWTLGLAGAFTADGLSDPVLFLEKGERPNPADPTVDEGGFFVRERSSAEDDYKLGAATFIHLYHNDHAKLRFLGLNLVPLSFGLGISDGSQAKYFLGTGLRFGTRAFLTGGVVLGSRNRLPDSLGVGDFTADQNALKTLARQTSDEWFLSLSFRGLDIDPSRLSAPFKKAAAPTSE